MQRTTTILLGLALVLSLTTGWLIWREADGTASNPVLTAFGAPFTLTDQDGHLRNDKSFRGRWMLLYFGYTFCPDVCPTTLALEAAALPKLGDKANRVVPVFVSIDPERDTPSVLKTYLAAFGPSFVGLTGKPADVAHLAHAYHVFYQKHPLSGGSYSVDHSSVIFLVDPNGRTVKYYDDPTDARALADDLAKEL